MKMRDFENLVASVTYKPGWEFYIQTNPWSWNDDEGGKVLRFFHDEPDSADPTRRADAINQVVIEPGMVEKWTKAQAIEFLRHRIMLAEEHEMQEFFKVGGVQMYDPHPELKSRSITAA